MSLCFPIATSHRQLLGKEPVMPREQMEHFHFILTEPNCPFTHTFHIYG